MCKITEILQFRKNNKLFPQLRKAITQKHRFKTNTDLADRHGCFKAADYAEFLDAPFDKSLRQAQGAQGTKRMNWH